MSREQAIVDTALSGTEQEHAVHEYVNRALNESVEERGAAQKPKTLEVRN